MFIRYERQYHMFFHGLLIGVYFIGVNGNMQNKPNYSIGKAKE